MAGIQWSASCVSLRLSDPLALYFSQRRKAYYSVFALRLCVKYFQIFRLSDIPANNKRLNRHPPHQNEKCFVQNEQ
jgi:hypothetical protein